MKEVYVAYFLVFGLLCGTTNAEENLAESANLHEPVKPITYDVPVENLTETGTLPSDPLNIESVSTNTTITDPNGTSPDPTPPKYIHCLKGYTNETVVQLTNDTELIKLLVPDPKYTTDKDSPAPCIAVLFYSKNCRFSSLAAPHYNALPRAFPDIKFVAINAMKYHLFNTQNGIVGVPTMLIFHNGKPVIRYNVSEYTLESFIKFITRHTGLKAVDNSVVTSADFSGPVVSSPSKESDMFLILSWLFIITCSCYYFTKSKWWTLIVETIQRNWRDSEVHAQHEHQE